MRPRDVRTTKELYSLSSDHKDTAGYWLMVLDNGKVTLVKQRQGEKSTNSIDIPKRTFNALIDWYNRDQRRKNR